MSGGLHLQKLLHKPKALASLPRSRPTGNLSLPCFSARRLALPRCRAADKGSGFRAAATNFLRIGGIGRILFRCLQLFEYLSCGKYGKCGLFSLAEHRDHSAFHALRHRILSGTLAKKRISRPSPRRICNPLLEFGIRKSKNQKNIAKKYRILLTLRKECAII